MNKRGQFYLIAAIIIIVAISSIASLATYVIVKPEPKIMKDVSSNLKEESIRIIDYGIYNGKDLTSLVKGFTQKDFASYILQKTNDANITFIYGNKTGLKKVQYSMADSGDICMTATSTTSCLETKIINIQPDEIQLKEDDKQTNVTILDQTFSFKLRENEMFYFVLTKQGDGEIYVETNQ